MRLIFIRTIICAIALLIVYGPRAAHACRADKPLHMEDMRKADIVFSGKLIRYEHVVPLSERIRVLYKRIFLGLPTGPNQYGLLTVRVNHVFKGSASGDIQLYWANTARFFPPETMERAEPILIAALGVNSKNPHRTDQSTLPQILQSGCSPPFILYYSEEDAENIVTILSKGRNEP